MAKDKKKKKPARKFEFPGAPAGYNEAAPRMAARPQFEMPGGAVPMPAQVADALASFAGGGTMAAPLESADLQLPPLSVPPPADYGRQIAGNVAGMQGDLGALQRQHEIDMYGPGTIQAHGFGGGHIGPISEAEMAGIMAGPGPGFREQANNPDPRNLGSIPMPERINPAMQALPPEELAALQMRLERDAPTGQMNLSPSQPLQAEPGYPDLIAAARAKLAGQDVPVPTVVGSGRYAGGSPEAQQMQRQSWQHARQARAARRIDQAGRMENDPMTQYRAGRAGNQGAAMQYMLGRLGGADSVAGRAFVLGPDNAARVELGRMDNDARQGVADAEAEQMRAFMKQKEQADLNARVQALVDAGKTPQEAIAQAQAERGMAPQTNVPPPLIAAPGTQTLPGRAIGGITNWYDSLTQDMDAYGIPRWMLGLGHGVMGALRGK